MNAFLDRDYVDEIYHDYDDIQRYFTIILKKIHIFSYSIRPFSAEILDRYLYDDDNDDDDYSEPTYFGNFLFFFSFHLIKF